MRSVEASRYALCTKQDSGGVGRGNRHKCRVYVPATASCGSDEEQNSDWPHVRRLDTTWGLHTDTVCRRLPTWYLRLCCSIHIIEPCVSIPAWISIMSCLNPPAYRHTTTSKPAPRRLTKKCLSSPPRLLWSSWPTYLSSRRPCVHTALLLERRGICSLSYSKPSIVWMLCE